MTSGLFSIWIIWSKKLSASTWHRALAHAAVRNFFHLLLPVVLLGDHRMSIYAISMHPVLALPSLCNCQIHQLVLRFDAYGLHFFIFHTTRAWLPSALGDEISVARESTVLVPHMRAFLNIGVPG